MGRDIQYNIKGPGKKLKLDSRKLVHSKAAIYTKEFRGHMHTQKKIHSQKSLEKTFKFSP